ncbi:MAG: methyltransferase domain-containing protein [Gemmatimonadales bacterium]|nr:methyltransferase domain-containing protein [Candidatus Palauibacter irciniicola]MYC19373.1 methyltransferase domain-containing protein [Gemmatimonadales bacterium]
MTEGDGESAPRNASNYWDTLAPHHWRIEDNYLDVSSLRRILGDIREPVLIIGAGQGLIVEELRRQGLRCDGIDLSARMLEYARSRRGLTLVRANATSMPFVDGSYETIILATGVIDFMADLQDIETVMREATRIVSGTGNVIVAFYRFSAAQERFLTSLGFLREDTLHMRSALALHRLGFGAMVAWVAKMARISTFQAVLLCIGTGLGSTKQERAIALAMRRLIAQSGDPEAFIEAAPETQPYRDKSAIAHLLDSLSIRIDDWQASSSCHLVRVSGRDTLHTPCSDGGDVSRT